ncbi:hypothetical protein PR048_024937 [Dryococelus australis]|uniref:Uncharacterized protein n=1 Tax=Dryococelus australis TaxID=614101 RepID=A0ABQ9GPY0_9NEOP|nr:hypothetical protein PR048_024937 [Dryococelus australis]
MVETSEKPPRRSCPRSITHSPYKGQERIFRGMLCPRTPDPLATNVEFVFARKVGFYPRTCSNTPETVFRRSVSHPSIAAFVFRGMLCPSSCIFAVDPKTHNPLPSLSTQNTSFVQQQQQLQGLFNCHTHPSRHQVGLFQSRYGGLRSLELIVETLQRPPWTGAFIREKNISVLEKGKFCEARHWNRQFLAGVGGGGVAATQNRIPLLQCPVATVQIPPESPSFIACRDMGLMCSCSSEISKSVGLCTQCPKGNRYSCCCMKLLSDGSQGLCPIFDNFTFQGSAISVGQDWRLPRTYSIGTMPIAPPLTQNECDLVRLLVSNLCERGSIPGGVTPGFSYVYVRIVPDDTADRRAFSGISCFPCPCIPALLYISFHPHLLTRPLNTGDIFQHAGPLLIQTLPPSPKIREEGIAQGPGKRLDQGFGRLNKRTARYIAWVCSPTLEILANRRGANLRARSCRCRISDITRPQFVPIAFIVTKLYFRRGTHLYAAYEWGSAGIKRALETRDPRENPPTSGISRHDSHLRKSGIGPAGDSTRFALVRGQQANR